MPREPWLVHLKEFRVGLLSASWARCCVGARDWEGNEAQTLFTGFSLTHNVKEKQSATLHIIEDSIGEVRQEPLQSSAWLSRRSQVSEP